MEPKVDAIGCVDLGAASERWFPRGPPTAGYERDGEGRTSEGK